MPRQNSGLADLLRETDSATFPRRHGPFPLSHRQIGEDEDNVGLEAFIAILLGASLIFSAARVKRRIAGILAITTLAATRTIPDIRPWHQPLPYALQFGRSTRAAVSAIGGPFSFGAVLGFVGVVGVFHIWQCRNTITQNTFEV